MRKLCKLRGALVIAECTVSEAAGHCPVCNGTSFFKDGSWDACECGEFAMENTPPRKYQIRPLDWSGDQPAIAHGLGVEYLIFNHNGMWRYYVTFGDCTNILDCESLEDGKAKCQAHWEALLSDYLE